MTGSLPEIVIIGAGLAGLTAAATLARHGLPVTVLEAQAIPGGCASTFYHQGYRFDSGATLAGGFFSAGPMDLVGRACGVQNWPAFPTTLAMQVHTSDGTTINLSGGPERWESRKEAFGPHTAEFWEWQEQTAEAVWQLALKLPAWPPQSISQFAGLLGLGLAWLAESGDYRSSLSILRDAVRPISAHLPKNNPRLVEVVDAQLLISTQTTSRNANALYGAAALDLPRRGVAHIAGGIGALAETLVHAIKQNGGQVIYHQEAKQITFERNNIRGVVTKRGNFYPAQAVISNIPRWNTEQLINPGNRDHKNMYPSDGWGAFMLYLGVDAGLIPQDFPLHHQVIRARPLGEGNTIFLSASPEWDVTRAPAGRRSITISTHTSLRRWWELFETDRDAYQASKQAYINKILLAAQTILPGIREATDLLLPGTPVTFQRFTRRAHGWVGGFPQTGLWRSEKPYLGRNLWMVGDSIFPGQSTAAASLGGLRVAFDIIKQLRIHPQITQEDCRVPDSRLSAKLACGPNRQISPTYLLGTKSTSKISANYPSRDTGYGI